MAQQIQQAIEVTSPLDGLGLLLNINDKYTGESIQYKQSNGLSDSDIDDVMVIKRSGKYYKRVCDSIDIAWFGGKANNTDEIMILDSAISSAIKFKIYKVHFSGRGVFNISRPLVVNSDIDLDLNFSELLYRGGECLIINGYNNIMRNIVFNVAANQNGIRYAPSSHNNYEIGCTTTRGLGLLAVAESLNKRSKTNISESLFKIRNISNVNKKKYYEIDINVGASENATGLVVRAFPNWCFIHELRISDIGGSPDFSFDFLYWGVSRARQSSDYQISNVNYSSNDLQDNLVLNLRNYKASPTIFKLTAIISDSQFCTVNKVWSYANKLDFIRPHKDTVPPNNTAVNRITTQQAEFRYRDNLGALGVVGATPVRNSDRDNFFPVIKIPSPAGVTQGTSSSELKFYFDYSASMAARDRPDKFTFEIRGLSKAMNLKVLSGWYSQNRDGEASYLNQKVFDEKDISVPSGTVPLNPFVIEIDMDPKAYDYASTIEGQRSQNFFYFTLFQPDSGYTPFLFNEEVMFNAFFSRNTIDY